MGERSESKNIPAVAIVLIGLGVLFLLHTMNIFEFGIDRFWPLILIFFGGWSSPERGMSENTRGLHLRELPCSQSRRLHCPCDRCRMRKIMGPAILLTIGTLFLLQSLNVVSFDRTWPAILLVIGVVKLLQSNASSAGHVSPLQPAPPADAPPPPPTNPPPSNPMPSNPGPALLPGRCAMSSPVSDPVPPPVPAPLPPRRRRSFAGPVVLIILGIVFLLGNMHLLSWARLGTFVRPLLAAAVDSLGSAQADRASASATGWISLARHWSWRGFSGHRHCDLRTHCHAGLAI